MLDSPVTELILNILSIIAVLLAVGVGIMLVLRGWRFRDKQRNTAHCTRCHTATPSPTPALPVTCANCNKVTRRKRELFKPQRHWKSIIGGLVLFTIGTLFITLTILTFLRPTDPIISFEEDSPWPWLLWGAFWVIIGALLVYGGWRMSDGGRWKAHCRKCRYDLRGHGNAGSAAETTAFPVTCPECGREATKHKHLFKPKKRRRLIALGLISLIAGSALLLTPEVEEKGGWSFVGQATVFLIALPHLEDPRSWEVYGDLEDALYWSAQQRWSDDYDDEPNSMWGWMRWLAIRRAIAAAGSKSEDCQLAAITLMYWSWEFFDEAIPKGRKKRWIKSLLAAGNSTNPDLVEVVGDAWPEEYQDQWMGDATEQLIATLTAHLDSPDGALVDAAMGAIVSNNWVSPRHIGAIRKELNSGIEQRVISAMWMVEQLGSEAALLSDDLLALMHPESSVFTAQVAASLLLSINEQTAEMLRHRTDTLIRSEDPEDQLVGISIVAVNQPAISGYLQRVIEIAKHGDQNCKQAMYCIFAIAPSQATQYFFEFLNDGNPTVRFVSIEMLSSMVKYRDESADEVLRALEDVAHLDADSAVRAAALDAAKAIRDALDAQASDN